MNIPAVSRLRVKLAADTPVYGVWITLESPSLTEMAVALGVDWVVIDAEHGHLDWKEIVEHLRAGVRSETVTLVRVAELNAALIKRALDLGADGIVVPWIETVDQLKQAIAYASYPPEGVRGIGAERATAWGQCMPQHTAEANDHVLVVPLIETVTAARNIDALGAVNGAELYFFGPADFSSSAGYRGQWEGPGVASQLLAMKDTLRAHQKHCGIMCTSPENLIERRHQGFRMLGLGSDTSLFLRSVHAALGMVGQDRPLQPSLAPHHDFLPVTPLPCPPESIRPDRPEVMNLPGKNPTIELAPGVHLDCLVGAHNQARNLTTGLVTVKPGAKLDYHTHPVSEAITVLSGVAMVGVENREYLLNPLDTVVVPRGLPHSAWNPSTAAAIVHVALASASPGREPASAPANSMLMREDSQGAPGKERITRFKTAARSAAGPGTSFIDYFNKDLVPGIEMSGGYGAFQPGGRLPAHFHDFDESICIIEGTATCVVEGRRYSMADCATALQPRGRLHYFINESSAPMAMIWVYAGPVPERIVVDERCATIEGNPWK